MKKFCRDQNKAIKTKSKKWYLDKDKKQVVWIKTKKLYI